MMQSETVSSISPLTENIIESHPETDANQFVSDEASSLFEARHKQLLACLPVGIYTCDKDGRITFFNDVAVDLWGYRPDTTDEKLRYCACHKVWTIDGTFLPPDQTPMAVALRTGQSFRNVEALVERPDGTKFYANVTIDPLLDAQKNVIGAINIIQDISQNKKTELALKQSEARYRNLVHSLNTPLYTTDEKGRITLYNKAAADLWGCEPEIGIEYWCGPYKIVRPDGTDLPLNECPMAVCLREQRPVTGEEILIARPDGTFIHVEPHSQPLYDSSGIMNGAINMLVDITKIKDVEFELRENEKKYRDLADTLEKKVEEKAFAIRKKNRELVKSEERYHKMVDGVEDYAIILLDRNGIVLNWNKGAEKIKGYKDSEIVGKSFELFYRDEDQEAGLPYQLIKEATKTGKAASEGWRVKKGGNVFWGSTVITTLHDDEGYVLGFSKVTRDLTERKMAEDRLKEYSSELEFQNRELEQFAYAASHDMKEPLRKIHLYYSFIADNPANVLDTKSQDYLQRSLRSISRMSTLIEDLLAYSRTSAGTHCFQPVDMNTVVNEIVAERKDDLEQKLIVVDIQPLPIVSGIPFQCKQLMQNLMDNAIKYRHPNRPGYINISSSLVSGELINKKNVENDKQYFNISVADNGVGFEQSYADKIFEIFQRLNNLQDVKGSGIGLAICKRIVQNHKGFIVATGVMNEGARFEVFLPADPLPV